MSTKDKSICYVEPNLKKILLLFDINERCCRSIFSHDGCGYRKKLLENCEAVLRLVSAAR